MIMRTPSDFHKPKRTLVGKRKAGKAVNDATSSKVYERRKTSVRGKAN
jgi:hypothetical protein